MILEVYDEQKKGEKVRLRLIQDGLKVYLQVVDKDGYKVRDGSMLVFYPNGRIIRNTGFNPTLGFPVDPKTDEVLIE